jgi:serine/threonine protein phosphatase 1
MRYRSLNVEHSPLVQRFATNPHGRDLIVGDIHGCFDKLQMQLDVIGFDPDAGDRLFSVGDLVDRGPQSDAVLDWLDQPWFHPVLGNHELMALLYTAGDLDEDEYTANGGEWFLRSSPVRRHEIALRLGSLPVAIELATARGTVGIVHADCPTEEWPDFTDALESDPDEDFLEGLVETALWSRERYFAPCEDDVDGVRAVVVGHTTLEDWTRLGNVIYIDTGAWIEDEDRDFCILDAATLLPVIKQP